MKTLPFWLSPAASLAPEPPRWSDSQRILCGFTAGLLALALAALVAIHMGWLPAAGPVVEIHKQGFVITEPRQSN